MCKWKWSTTSHIRQLEFFSPMASPAKKLINNPEDVVSDVIEGLVETYPGLQYLDGSPEVKVVLRSDVSSKTNDKVAVISGGGSGHEPAHAGFVGEGLPTAAICGDVFASPPVDADLSLTLAVVGEIELISQQHRLREITIFDINWNALEKASPVLAGLLDFVITYKRGQPIIRVEESEVQAFHDLLHFLDDRDPLDVSGFSVDRWLDLQKMADKFAVIQCLDFCNTTLASLPITCKLAFFYLDPPYSFGSQLVQHAAEEYLLRTCRDVHRHWEDILYLPPALFKTLIMDDHLKVQDENTILELCSEWSSGNEGRVGFLKENIVKLVRWQYLSIDQLFETKRILKAEGGSDEVGRNMSFIMSKQVSKEVTDAIYYQLQSAKNNQSVFIDWNTIYKKYPARVTDYALWDYKLPRDVERDYEIWPVRASLGLHSECIISFDFNRNNLGKLLLGQRVNIQEVSCFNTNTRFRLFSHCGKIGSKKYFGLHVRVENENPQNDFTCKLYVFSKTAVKSEVKRDGFVLKHEMNLRSGWVAGCENLLGLTLGELISEASDSTYFLNGKIFFRVILDQS